MAKRLFQLLFRLVIGIAYWLYRIEGVNAVLLIMPAKLIVPTLRKFGAAIGQNVEIHSPLIIHNARDGYRHLVIGGDCYFGRDVFLDLSERITIEDQVTISMRVSIITHLDVGKSPLSKGDFRPVSAPVCIKSGAYLGAGAMVLHGVTIGEQAAVGALALVNKDVPAQTLVAGVPARPIRDLKKV